MSDAARNVLNDPRAPEGERLDALAEMEAKHRPTGSDLMKADDIRSVIEAAQRQAEMTGEPDPFGLAGEPDMLKAGGASVVPFPGRSAAQRGPKGGGMRSVQLDGIQAQVSGSLYDKPGMTFDGLRRMVDGTPLLSAIVMTRVRQVMRFVNPSEDGGLGFEIRHRDRKHERSEAEEADAQLMARFFSNCGWEFDPRRRKRMRRDPFGAFMGKLVRDTLTMDAAPIETEMKRDASMGIDGLYAIDGSTIRLCTDEGYEGDDEIFAVQMVEGQVRTLYSHDQLIYEVRNPRTDVRLCGYGLGEAELLVRVVTGWLNALNLNVAGFSQNSIPRGLLQLTGDYSQDDLAAFRRMWAQMTQGAQNRFALPVLVSKDAEGKAAYTPLDNQFDEMMFAKWMTFLTAISCAIFSIDPSEIAFESFSAAGRSALAGSDTEEKLALSKDKGFVPLMSYFEGVLSDYVVATFDPDLVFRWTGLEERDRDKEWEAKKMVLTVDEMRAEQGYEPHPDPKVGALPLNPVLTGPAMQLSGQTGADFGGEAPEGDFGQEDGDEDGPQGQGGAPGAPGDAPRGGDEKPDTEGDYGAAPPEGDFGKALSGTAALLLRSPIYAPR